MTSLFANATFSGERTFDFGIGTVGFVMTNTSQYRVIDKWQIWL